MDDGTFLPHLDILPGPQRVLWEELNSTPASFTLYGGTALALRLGHRTSIDFDFFSNEPFDPDRLVAGIPYLNGAERIQLDANTLTCRVDRDGPVLVSFFGNLRLGQVAPHGRASGTTVRIASLLDIAGTKVSVVQKRAQVKDYLDIDALLQNGVDLPSALSAASIIYGNRFNPLISLKALSYFDDMPKLPAIARTRLSAAVSGVDPTRLPKLTPLVARSRAEGNMP